MSIRAPDVAEIGEGGHDRAGRPGVSHGVPVASAVRKGEKSTVAPTTASPVPPGFVAMVGPVAAPHQLFWASMVSVPRYWTPMLFPSMLF